ncbi:MAG: hypothetical protein AAB618_02625 [Patescibacteria group bacterium]
MFFDVGRSARIREKIGAINLAPYLAKATELFGLAEEDYDAATREYRHFLYLAYWNKRLAGDTMVVPTKQADALWHAHLLYTRDYADMCQNIFGTFLHHSPGLEEGTTVHEKALKHTKRLHDEVGRRDKPGFDEDYFSFVDVSEPMRQSSSGSDSGGDNNNVSFEGGPRVSIPYVEHGGSFGGGGASGTWSSDSPSSSSYDGGSSSSSCGGGGCGGD